MHISFRARHTNSHVLIKRRARPSARFRLCPQSCFFLPAQFFKSLTCILLSFTLPPPLPVFPLLPPLSPCGFCHLFTDEWPLHRHDLNVSHPSHYGALPLFLSPSSCSLPISLPVRLEISQFFSTSSFFPPYLHFLSSANTFDQFHSCVLFYRCMSSSPLYSCIRLMTDYTCKCYITISAQHAYNTARAFTSQSNLTRLPLFSSGLKHQAQLCNRVTAALFSIDPDASHLRKYHKQN